MFCLYVLDDLIYIIIETVLQIFVELNLLRNHTSSVVILYIKVKTYREQLLITYLRIFSFNLGNYG